ncbi:MAG: signal peptidase II [Alphaproteobacteria bacterium GM7ARS4]|nr:signal peptidase II [Alphaproteobacteria bacterium GM7ARS4]
MMTPLTHRRYGAIHGVIALGIAGGVVVADYISKVLILETFLPRPFMAIDVFPHVDFVFVLNRGVSFGMLAQWAIPPWALGAFAWGAALGLILWAAMQRHKPFVYALAMIAGGAFGNGMDRFLYGAVVDFIDVTLWGGYHWPAFNIADTAITCGALLFVIHDIRMRHTKH